MIEIPYPTLYTLYTYPTMYPILYEQTLFKFKHYQKILIEYKPCHSIPLVMGRYLQCKG